MNASQNQKKTLSFGLAVIPILAMLLLLIIGYGIMGLRIEPMFCCSRRGYGLVARVLLGRHH